MKWSHFFGSSVLLHGAVFIALADGCTNVTRSLEILLSCALLVKPLPWMIPRDRRFALSTAPFFHPALRIGDTLPLLISLQSFKVRLLTDILFSLLNFAACWSS